MMVAPLRAFLCILLCAVLLPAAAFSEDCFVIDVDSLDMNLLNDNAYVAAHLSAQAQGVRVVKYISDSNELAARVQLTIVQAETSAVVFDKFYGYVSGTFDSGVIYLPFVDNNVIPYLITLNIENWTYAMPFMHTRPRLTNNSACTYGVRLRDQNPALTDSWLMGTMLDLDTLRAQGVQVVPICASNLYQVGQATLAVAGDRLTVTLAFADEADVELQSCAVYLIPRVAMLTTADPANMAWPAWAPGQGIDITGLRTALLYVPISLNYNSTALSEFSYDTGSAELAAQLTLWADNVQQAVSADPQAVTETAETQTGEPAATVSAKADTASGGSVAATDSPGTETDTTPAP